MQSMESALRTQKVMKNNGRVAMYLIRLLEHDILAAFVGLLRNKVRE